MTVTLMEDFIKLDIPLFCGYCSQKINANKEIIRQSMMFENKALGVCVPLHKKCKALFLHEMEVKQCLCCGSNFCSIHGNQYCPICTIKNIKQGKFC